MTLSSITPVADSEPASAGTVKNSFVYMSEIRNSFVFPLRKGAFVRLPSPFAQ